MRRLVSGRGHSSQGVDINLSPLIDVVFLLLIFFVVTTVFVEETGITVQKPAAVSARQLERKSILIALTANGDIIYGGQSIGLNGVRGIVSRQLEQGDAPVILIGDATAQLGLLVDLIDECKLAGATTVSIAAERE
jgi:biopolymer transport protein ExbD